MAKAKPIVIDKRAGDVMVMARAGFKHRGVFVRTGETIYMTEAEARDLVALHMIELLRDGAAHG